MTPEKRDELITAILQAAVNWLPEDFDELWLVIESEDHVANTVLFFTSADGPARALSPDFPDELDEAVDDLIDTAGDDGEPFHRAVLSYRSSGGASADFDHEPLPGGVVEGSNARMEEFGQTHLGRSWADTPEYTG
ncbi:hypothetical protein CGZ94_09200 [Enemella evansiae]|uniref:DUF600 family protein n=1 Tax=Enemella evansiae TaxID=2016499 RepID=A0A255GFW1_9ACTN|nr:hypothetical protein [Enemella evansiae]OYO14729.1 hypothetical protein CGZ94_09200 [Enemella evansiae]